MEPNGRTGRGGVDGDRRSGTPYAPHTPSETAAMLAGVGADDEADLFDVPDPVTFDDEFGIPARSEQAVRREVGETLARNDDLVEFLGRGHYAHYVPAPVDHLADRSEFITSYTQYQPEVTQGFLQALFEYQSTLVELTGLAVANCSMYDGATGLGEAALLADRVRRVEGDRVLVPETLRPGKRSTLSNYVDGAGLTVVDYPLDDGIADIDAIGDLVGEETAMVYAETPTVRGTIEERLGAIGDRADDAGALFCVGSDPIALALLEQPASVGADVVVGEAGVLGVPRAYGMGLGLFAVSDNFLRQVPGRLVGAGDDADGRRAFTLTLQTREQHIRKERATSNICTNQAWVALRAAIHAASLGPDGLAELARECVRRPRELAADLDAVDGLTAPVHDRHHFREFVVGVEGRDAGVVARDLADEGFAVHTLSADELQVCVTDDNAHAATELVAAFEEVI